ncbi:hypothetical protein CPB84DRAFT_1749702 [Gymnopilus junonius]|uniref:Uncharacterized protein n=1 Tax=Gymnopilus junonius TaxID=109634 RepID=A0A9P5NGX9_GYMJU|nr:hypothetical protein CPB84DRAFT_1749702 [Gymnopilus junonius]
MPEFRESLAHFLYFFAMWNLYKGKTSFVLFGLWADYTAAEVKRTGKGKEGLVQKLDSTCAFKRGTKGCQTLLFPQSFRKSKARPNPSSLQTLELKKVEHTSRAIFFTFGSMCLKVAYLTHTSIQWYTREQWECSVRTIPKEHRGKIGLALKFKEHIIAFVTNDLVFQPTGFKDEPVGYALDWHARFYFNLINYHPNLAPGLSPFLTEGEVFDCPSRTIQKLIFSRALLNSATVDSVLAPTQEQHLKYIHWLHVYAKNTTQIPKHMSKLVDSYNDTLTFEKKTINLGHLVFGEKDWKHLDGLISLDIDPLSCMFAEQGLLKSQMNLLLDSYENLYPPQNKSDYQFWPTYAYAVKKQIWSIVHCFPPNSHCSEGLKVRMLESLTSRSTMVLNIDAAFSQSLSLKPKELQLDPSSTVEMAVFYAFLLDKKRDPVLSLHQITQQAKHEFRIKNNLVQPGKAKVAMTGGQREAQQEFIQKALRCIHGSHRAIW